MYDKINLLDLNYAELENVISGLNEPKYRALQIYKWIHKSIVDFDDMTNISKELRGKLSNISTVSSTKIYKKFRSKIDNTTKYLFELYDGNIIESVFMEYNHGYSVCVSSQVGCRMGCKFCASTKDNFVRNLTPGEITSQILAIQKDLDVRISNIVIMGIGEPFDNYDNVIKFIRNVNDPQGLNIGIRHISISTCGLVDKIYDFIEEKLPVTLSISLHAPNNDLRKRIMPISSKYSIDKLIEACKIYTETLNRRIIFEYSLISGVNDANEQAIELAKIIKNILCHVNLIPVNEIEGLYYKKSNKNRIEIFKSVLYSKGIGATVRRKLGSDINAACGQLRTKFIK